MGASKTLTSKSSWLSTRPQIQYMSKQAPITKLIKATTGTISHRMASAITCQRRMVFARAARLDSAAIRCLTHKTLSHCTTKWPSAKNSEIQLPYLRWVQRVLTWKVSLYRKKQIRHRAATRWSLISYRSVLIWMQLVTVMEICQKAKWRTFILKNRREI